MQVLYFWGGSNFRGMFFLGRSKISGLSIFLGCNMKLRRTPFPPSFYPPSTYIAWALDSFRKNSNFIYNLWLTYEKDKEYLMFRVRGNLITAYVPLVQQLRNEKLWSRQLFGQLWLVNGESSEFCILRIRWKPLFRRIIWNYYFQKDFQWVKLFTMAWIRI